MEIRQKLTALLIIVCLCFTPNEVSCQISKDLPNLQNSSLYSDFPHDFTLRSPPSVQDIHLALAGHGLMRVDWLNPVPFKTGNFFPQCFYSYNPTNMHIPAKGAAATYPHGFFELTLNTAIIDLHKLPSLYKTVYYRCGDRNYGWSEIHSFTLLPSEIKRGLLVSYPLIAIVGDLAVAKGEHTIASLARRTKSGHVQLLVHVGGISYANKYNGNTGNNSFIWVDYMNHLQPIASKIPYMVCPGEPENQFDFAAYLNWFRMPYSESGSPSRFFYSFDYMGVHFLSISTEHKFDQRSTQYAWIKRDLVRANTNRARVPWVIVFGHRPLYCTSLLLTVWCNRHAYMYRRDVEELLFQQRVDVFLSGQNNYYERSYPVYKEQIAQTNYDNPRAPVYIVNGAGGSTSFEQHRLMEDVPWRAYAVLNEDTGYLLMQAKPSQLHFQYVNSRLDTIVDKFTIRNSHRFA